MSLFSFATSPPLSCFCHFESLTAKGCAVLRLLILTVTYFRDRALSSAVDASAKRSGPRAGSRRLFGREPAAGSRALSRQTSPKERPEPERRQPP